jgi:hypothetical protein
VLQPLGWRCGEVGGGAVVVMVHFQFSWLGGLGKVIEIEGCSNIHNYSQNISRT